MMNAKAILIYIQVLKTNVHAVLCHMFLFRSNTVAKNNRLYRTDAMRKFWAADDCFVFRPVYVTYAYSANSASPQFVFV